MAGWVLTEGPGIQGHSQAESKASTWHPYNVELPEETAEEEVDDTQEIQIEEALKLYQTALKYHSEGPSSFDKTAAAYKALFESEIFKYAESLSEYQRHQVFGEDLVFDTILEDDYEAGPVQSTGAADSAPNTLQQILHLSYKNHGQFLLEAMQHWITTSGAALPREAWNNTRGALNYFAEALDKEDTDLDLWLRTASVAAMLGSKRLTRYCLEAVLDGNDEQWENLLRLPGLEEGFAGQQLRELVERLEDNVSLSQAPVSSIKRKKLSETLKMRLNPFPFAPLPADVALAESLHNIKTASESVTLTPTKWDWAGVGEIIVRQFQAEQQGMTPNVPSGSNIVFSIPPESETPERIEPDTIQETVSPAPELTPPPQIEELIASAADAETVTEKDGEDTIMEEQDVESEVKNEEIAPAGPSNVAPVPSRKRSTDSAGLPETAEGGRSRSKRIRGRESLIEPTSGGAAQEASKQLDAQLETYTYTDQCRYEILKDTYARLGVEGIKDPEELRKLVTALPDANATDPIDKAACDFFTGLRSGHIKVAQILLSSESFDLLGATREHGLNAFLGFSKATSSQASSKPLLGSEGLNAFARSVNNGWLPIQEVAFGWIESLFTPGFCSQLRDQSSYVQFRWAEDLKRNVVQVIVHIDEYIYERMVERVDSLNRRMLGATHQSQVYELSDFDNSQIEIVETLFELHLDIYSLIKHPQSVIDTRTQVLQSDRLERWSLLAREALQLRSDCRPSQGTDDLTLRHIWATVFQMSVNNEVAPEHVLSAMAELKDMFEPLGDHTIQLQNNAVMPELSVAAIEQELVRISMKDFFLKVFDQEEQDPVTVVESLEPILELANATELNTPPKPDGTEHGGTDTSISPSTSTNSEQQLDRASPILEMRKFLDSANVNVRLSLWNRLRVAYEAIDYPSKVLSCFLRSIEALVTDLRSTTFQELPVLDRQHKLLTRYRVIDDMVVKIIQIVRDNEAPFASIPYEHVQSSMSAITELLHIMSAADMLRDLIRVNHIPMPRVESQPSSAFVNMMSRLDDIHLRLWILQYHLLKDGMSQESEAFPNPSDDLFEYIRHVHHATGVRSFCHLSNRQFLRLAKDELLRMDDITDGPSHATELCQILNDLYGLKLFVDPLECQNFQTTTDVLDKKTAFSILSFTMSQAAKVDLKDLPKHELKGTIEKVHAALGRPKQNEDITFNRKVISSYFKSPVNPVALFGCLKGVGSLATKHIPPEEAVAASKGWYYMMGNMALSKFRSQKRVTQGPTEDLNYAQAFFVQDLEHSIERWETWYRLAQANDTQLEEAVSWNADKMNSNSAEVVNFQRAAINCYIMAVACATRDADVAPGTQSKIAQMYTEFGNRMYASSREPFGMEAFQIRESEKRFCNLQTNASLYKEVVFVPLHAYTAWKFASTLYKRAIKGNPNKWWNHFMLGKCGWKMWSANDSALQYGKSIGAPLGPQKGPTWESVVDAFVSAIETLPGKKGRSGEPVLEPHYKLVSITHKLHQRGAINYEKGPEILANTSYAQNIKAPENEGDWQRYILAVLKSLRAADKSSWHHRIISRVAHIIYDTGRDPATASEAKHELTQQMFTKTMAVQVWKPENERPGRHFVYTTRYTKFFIELLDLTGDKTNFEALAKRVRRKQTDFFEHQKLWQDLCLRYIRMLRKMGSVPEGQEDSAFKSVNHDEFNTLALRLEAWCQNPETQHPVLDILRDAIELKRLNNGMMKPLLIDDLIGDAYAMLYTSIGPALPPLQSEQQPQPPVQPTQPHPSPFAPNPASAGAVPISSLMQVQVDGAADGSSGTPFSMYHPNQLQPQHPPSAPQMPPQPEQVPKPRAKAVGRREIARRAEACVQKIASTPAQPTSMPIRSPAPGDTTIPSIVGQAASPETAAQPAPGPSTSAEHLQPTFDKSGTDTAAASINNDEPERSAPASIHDDADDESELSELDEDEVEEIHQEVQNDNLRRSVSIAGKPLFPNLAASRASPVEKRTETVSGEGNAGSKSAPVDDDDEDTIHVNVRGAGKKDVDEMDVDTEK
ncbi:Histone transcription regulator 3 [Alternaria tenuissima]|uniref:Histone transcription regulator 3 homolog n=1 Tax=Alternaria tenuissima TaxID=119927 RepID=A0AB37WV71_9PLEO|nr:Histone transcription regulator 3 [Alternaria tenuissima]RYN68393.1 Histone transcription regulator 3 [Alternaria tenuissima]RYO03108.1 Histone transcription regulator 3 [Alternaria tenuissima]RYO24634.1 Histone transcription regulator 3 [Alternaria tenuissima]